MNTGNIHDWHSIHNDECPQNGDNLEADCTCEQPTKRTRSCDEINRACIKKRLLEEANARQSLRTFTQVSKATLDAFQAIVKQEIIKRATNPPRKGKTL